MDREPTSRSPTRSAVRRATEGRDCDQLGLPISTIRSWQSFVATTTSMSFPVVRECVNASTRGEGGGGSVLRRGNVLKGLKATLRPFNSLVDENAFLRQWEENGRMARQRRQLRAQLSIAVAAAVLAAQGRHKDEAKAKKWPFGSNGHLCFSLSDMGWRKSATHDPSPSSGEARKTDSKQHQGCSAVGYTV